MDEATLYRDIVESSRDGIWVFDLEGRTLYANPALVQMLGVGPDEIASLSVPDFLDEAGRQQFEQHMREVRGGEVPEDHEVECRYLRRDGSPLWVLVRESPLFGPDGRLLGVVHRHSDHGHRRETMEQLRASRAALTEAQRIARVGSWTWDVEEDRITGSSELMEIFGFDEETFPRDYAEFLALVHDDDRPGVEEAVRNALEGDGQFDYTARIVHAGSCHWARGRGLVLRDETGRLSMAGTHQDVTEVVETELALRDQVLQNTLMQAVASAANEAATLAQVLGRARDLVLVHEDWERARGFMPDLDGDGVRPLYLTDADRLADEAMPEESAHDLALANRAYLARGPLWDDRRLSIGFPVLLDGEVHAVVVITSAPPLYRHDMIQSMVEQVAVQLGRVAERERTQRELADARDQAMAASRQKSEFLATMSHEIRTPLNGVIGLTDLLVRTELDGPQQRLVSGVQVASRALLAVINDVLDFSKIEAGKLELEQLDFDVRRVFDEAASILGDQARSKGLELVVSCHPDVPHRLRGDPTRLTQVLINLGSNAVKFTERGEVSIRATVEPADERVLLRVEVVDSGCGIEPDHLEGLFDPFTQADASTTRVHGGTGLGLAISREIVEAFGGGIGVQSEVGVGSRFWFTVLLDPPLGDAQDAEDVDARRTLSGRRVLVVDDHEHNRLILQELLGWWGIQATAVVDAQSAWELLQQAESQGRPYDAVLLDLAMPGRSGLELARAIRRQPEHDTVPLVLLSSASPDPARLEAVGITAALLKPVIAGQLRSVLMEHLAGRAPTARTQPVSPRPRPGRVLVVEDNEVNQLVAVGLLEAQGYDVTTVADGIAAVTALAPGAGDAPAPYDAVLMDVQMPRMDGYAATRLIREREPEGRRIPIIAMTASAVEGERERCLEAGMDDFLTKPVDPTALTAVMARWLEPPTRSGEQPMTAETPAEEPPVSPDDAAAAAGAQPALAGLDLERLEMLRELDPDNTAYLDRAIGNFSVNARTGVETLRTALDAADPVALRQAAHKLAGSALNLGVVDAGGLAREVELLADQGSVEGVGALVDRLEVSLAEALGALADYQRRHTDAGRAAPPRD